MASGEILLNLFKAFKENNQVEFTKVAYEVIEDEKRKNHYLLANKLEKVLFNSNNTTVSINNNSNNYMNKQLPVDKESGFPLMEMKFTKRDLDEIVLSKNNTIKIEKIIDEFNNKEILNSYNLYPKTKILFCGPPGTGKTITAEAISSILGIPMLYTRFDSIISSFLGETATNLRKVFDFSNDGEWVLFFDEFDSIAKSRDDSSEHGELKRVVNSFLQLMDSYSKNKIVIAATNYEKLIDKALWRRFDEIIFFDNPDKDEIEKIVNKIFTKYHKKNLNLDTYIDMLIGFSFADIERICKNSIKEMILNRKDEITNQLFLESIEREIERRNLVIKTMD
ncbi:ATP-binding protein [Clostridium perfringens]|nr:ATP-binding protein [Clostridium perfringens]